MQHLSLIHIFVTDTSERQTVHVGEQQGAGIIFGSLSEGGIAYTPQVLRILWSAVFARTRVHGERPAFVRTVAALHGRYGGRILVVELLSDTSAYGVEKSTPNRRTQS